MFTWRFPVPSAARQFLSAKCSQKGHYPDKFSPMSVGGPDIAFRQGVDEEHPQSHQ